MTDGAGPARRWLDQHAGELSTAMSSLLDQADRLGRWATELAGLYARGGRLLVAGNGGSAAEAQHLTSELVGRFLDDRRPLSAICLTAETSALTAIVNDYGAEEMFARQVQAHGRAGDVLVLLSTSGKSPNVLAAARRARAVGLRVWAMTGAHDNPLAVLADDTLAVDAPTTAAVQAGHLVAIHALCAAVDEELVGSVDAPSAAVSAPGPRGGLVVVGDVLLDVDVVGRSTRLSPDAPVPVVDVADRFASPGGAGLVALQAAETGAPVTLVAPLADDPDGRAVTSALSAAGVHVLRLPHVGATRTKTRIRSDGQSLVRLDQGGPGRPGSLPPHLREQVAATLRGATVVVVADYGAGVTASGPLRELLADSARHGRVVWDPHPRGGPPVPHCLLVTPNAAEAGMAVAGLENDTGAGGPFDRTATAAPDRWAERLAAHWQARSVAVTVGASGAFLAAPGEPARYLPAAPVTGDPCGAGDRLTVGAALAVADGALLSEAVERGVREATSWVADGGVAGWRARAAADPVSPDASESRCAADTVDALVDRVRARGGTVVATGGCFDIVHPGHVATLQAARRLGDVLVVVINSDDSVRRLKGEGRPVVPEDDRARVLSAFDCVDGVVVFEDDDPRAVLDRLRPDIWVKGGDYGGTPLTEAEVVERHGGRVVLLPYLSGRSTTAILARSTAPGTVGVDR